MESIRCVTENRRAYLPLLLEADPDEAMIGRYLDSGRMYVLEIDCELKNIAVDPTRQRQGLGRRLLQAVMDREAADYALMYVGTTAPTEGFYQSLGFVYSHTVEGFFVDNYPEPIFEDGVQCVDMRYWKRRIQP